MRFNCLGELLIAFELSVEASTAIKVCIYMVPTPINKDVRAARHWLNPSKKCWCRQQSFYSSDPYKSYKTETWPSRYARNVGKALYSGESSHARDESRVETSLRLNSAVNLQKIWTKPSQYYGPRSINPRDSSLLKLPWSSVGPC